MLWNIVSFTKDIVFANGLYDKESNTTFFPLNIVNLKIGFFHQFHPMTAFNLS